PEVLELAAGEPVGRAVARATFVHAPLGEARVVAAALDGDAGLGGHEAAGDHVLGAALVAGKLAEVVGAAASAALSAAAGDGGAQKRGGRDPMHGLAFSPGRSPRPETRGSARTDRGCGRTRGGRSRGEAACPRTGARP